MMPSRRFSLAGKLALLLFAVAAAAAALGAWLAVNMEVFAPALLATLTLLLVPILLLARYALRDLLSLFRSLTGTVNSYRDGDFGFGIAWSSDDELGELVAAHNALGETLREQRLGLVQRELLLDTMVQHTPVAMLLIGPGEHVVFGNLAARKLLNDGRRLEGRWFNELVAESPPALREALARDGDGLFSIGQDDSEEVFHLARRHFRLNGRDHELILLRQLTSELRRQEVQTWKKVIRVISHELNNSLAPIASLAHSGSELVRREQYGRLETIFTTIAERARHLEGFILGYARFAKLPAPRPVDIDWRAFVEQPRSQVAFEVDGNLPAEPTAFDVAQMEQVLLNLLKNAHESGSPPEDIRLRVRRLPQWLRIEVLDRGSGMSEQVLANALVPFYSTKRSGTGLGLALCREIVEAHGGRIALSNRDDGGLCVALTLPA